MNILHRNASSHSSSCLLQHLNSVYIVLFLPFSNSVDDSICVVCVHSHT